MTSNRFFSIRPGK